MKENVNESENHYMAESIKISLELAKLSALLFVTRKDFLDYLMASNHNNSLSNDTKKIITDLTNVVLKHVQYTDFLIEKGKLDIS